MKRCILLFTVFLFMYIPAYGDDGVLGGKGNTVYPISDTSVRMLGENVYIEVKDGKSFVRGEFIFQNTGKAEKLMVGFPAYGTDPKEEKREGFDDNPKLYDFKTYIEGKEIPTSIKKGLKEEGNNIGELYYPNWYVWNMSFKENGVYKVVNTYWVYNSYDSSGGQSVQYILRTGATWKDRINYGKITVEFEDVFDPQDIKLIDYDNYRKNENVVLHILPEDKKITWDFYDLEPSFDLNLYLQNNLEATKAYLLHQYTSPDSSREINTINGLGKKAYESFGKGDYDKTLDSIKKIEEFKDNKDQQVSEYALEIINWLDYYRARIYWNRGDIKSAEYYFKVSGIIQNRNYFDLIQMYRDSGDIDKYIQNINIVTKGNFYSQAIVPWAIQQFNQLPLTVRNRYEVQAKEGLVTQEELQPVEENEKQEVSQKNNFSARSFIFINIGIFTLILVVYWNIKKRR